MPRVRLATSKDLDLLVRHRRLMWVDIARHTGRQLDAADPVYRRWVAARLKSGKAAGFIVESKGTARASGVLWLMESHPRPGWDRTTQGYLLSMYTEPEFRRKGAAGAIVRAAMRWSKARGVDRITLHAAPKGRRLYEREGFRRTHEMRVFLNEPRLRARR